MGRHFIPAMVMAMNLAMNILLFLPWMAAGLPTSVELEDKTPSWVEICGSTFLFSEDKKTWNDAKGNCELYGGHLAQINGHVMNYCLLEYSHAQALPADWYWHSGNDILAEGVYRQFDESLIDFAPLWNDNGQSAPNGGKGENCLMVRLSEDAHAGRWADEPCTVALYYICQRD